MKLFSCLLAIFSPFLLAAQEPTWWTQKKHDCNLPSSLAYNTWVTNGSPCNNGNNTSRPSGPSTEQIEAKRAEAEKQERINEADRINAEGVRAFNSQDYDKALKFFEDAAVRLPEDPTINGNINTARNAILAKHRQNENFIHNKQEALSQMKDISQGESFDSNSGLKDGLNDMGSTNSGSVNELKTILGVNTDPNIVDARNVPTGLPKTVENSIPNTPAGDRVRKGFEAIMYDDWKLALAWFLDALNHEPGDPGLQRLVDLAQFTMEWRINHGIAPNNVPTDNRKISNQQNIGTVNTHNKTGNEKMNEEINKAFDDFYNHYTPKYSESTKNKPTKNVLLKGEDLAWKQFFKYIDSKMPKHEPKTNLAGDSVPRG